MTRSLAKFFIVVNNGIFAVFLFVSMVIISVSLLGVLSEPSGTSDFEAAFAALGIGLGMLIVGALTCGIVAVMGSILSELEHQTHLMVSGTHPKTTGTRKPDNQEPLSLELLA